MIWNDEAVATLRRMAGEGKSFTDAAEVLGCSRSAVAGKASRIGLAFAGDLSPTAKARRSEGCRRSWAEMTPEARAHRLDATLYKTPAHAKRPSAS